jgi:hypothetical protein
MERYEEIDRLKARLQWDSGGPLAHLAAEAMDALAARAKALAGWLREIVEERPLISLLYAFQLGVAAGRWGSVAAFPPQRGRVHAVPWQNGDKRLRCGRISASRGGSSPPG